MMRRNAHRALAGAVLLALAGLLPTAAAAVPPPAEVPLPPVSGIEDEGTFYVYVNETPLVTIPYTWKSDGSYDGEQIVAMGGQSVTARFAMKADSTGVWKEMHFETPRGPVSVTREGAIARITQGKETTTVELKPGTLLFENMSPALMTLVVRAYDQARGGKQTFPLFIVPAVVMEASLERRDPVTRTVAGRDLALGCYAYALPGVDLTLYVDENQRVIYAEVPAQHAAYVREGYEGLLAPAEADSLLSQPRYEVDVERGVGVPMRDGLALATDLYRPRAAGPFPAILVRTPYKKEMNELQAMFYARRGYVFAVQDCRGRFSSPGVWEPFVNESHDGYDTIEWLAAQPWCTGRVGTIGGSYLGWVQWWAARDRPPHLAAMIPNVSPPAPFYNIPYEYGAFFLMGAIWWADVLETEATGDLSGKKFQDILEKKYARLLRHRPVVELDEIVLGRQNPYWRQWIAHPTNDAYWEPANFLDRLRDLEVPVFHQSGWFDGDGIGTKLNYLRMVACGHRYQKLVLGPWGHTDTATRRIGERDFGPAAIVDLQRDYLRWMDHWLKGVENGIDREPLVSLFAMGANRWLRGDTYPLPGTQLTPYYLTSGGKANTSAGDGSLATERPGAQVPPDRYTYDPGDPTPSPTFYVDPADLEEKAPEGEAPPVERSSEEERRKVREYYGRVDAERQDILVYQTPVLTDTLTIAGPVSATLFASTSGRDTDWVMRLSEVDASGEVFPLTEGKLRARFRDSLARPQLLKPGKVYEYHLDLWQTGIAVLPGRRLRVEVASATFPLFSANLNTGGKNEEESTYVVARQTVYHDAKHPSHVLLPVIPREGGQR